MYSVTVVFDSLCRRWQFKVAISLSSIYSEMCSFLTVGVIAWPRVVRADVRLFVGHVEPWLYVRQYDIPQRAVLSRPWQLRPGQFCCCCRFPAVFRCGVISICALPRFGMVLCQLHIQDFGSGIGCSDHWHFMHYKSKNLFLFGYALTSDKFLYKFLSATIFWVNRHFLAVLSCLYC